MRRALLSVLVLAALSVCAACAGSKRYSTQFLDVFDTVSMEIGYTKTEEAFTEASAASHKQLLREHQLYDIYNSYDGLNNLKTVNDQAGVGPVQVDPELIDLVKWGKDVYRLTNGKVNIAYGAVLQLWHEKREQGLADPDLAALPDADALAEAARHTDIDDVVIDASAGTIYLRDPEMRLDVGGIGKGYAAEKAARLLQNAGADHFLLNLGGNLRAIGTKGDGTKWVCPVESPDYRDDQRGDPYAVTCYLNDLSLVTSGVILVVCGYAISLMSSIPAISQVGHLVGRGAIFSVIFVTLLMPFLLQLADRFITVPAATKHARRRAVIVQTVTNLQNRRRARHQRMKELLRGHGRKAAAAEGNASGAAAAPPDRSIGTGKGNDAAQNEVKE